MPEEKVVLKSEETDIGIRLDKYISSELSDLSRSFIQKLLDESAIVLLSDNGEEKRVKASYKLKAGDCFQVTIPEPTRLDIVAENIPLNIVYEDDDVIVIDKPQGMVVHPAAGNYSGTLVNALMYHCGDSLSTINGIERPGIVHRIDKDTSGLLVICKNDKAHQSLAKQFEEHSINRIYSSIVYNHFDIEKMIRLEKESDENGNPILPDSLFPEEMTFVYTDTVNKPIARAKNDRKKMAIDPNGRRAVTHIYLQKNLQENYSYIKCKLETGRTHQIRVHLTSINHPLLGDPVYGPKNCPFKLDGQVLHAGTLGFVHPRTSEYMEFQSELPKYFTRLLERFS